MKRWLLIGGGVIVILVALALYALYTSLDAIIEAAIETYGSEIMQTRVALDGVEISPTTGEGALRGLSVANPKGFKADHAFELGEIKLSLDLGTLTQDVIVVKEIVIDKPAVTYELTPAGTNISALQKNVQAYSGTSEQAAETEADTGGPKLLIRNLYVRGGEVTVRADLLDQPQTARLPDLHLTNIGSKTGGATPGELANLIMANVTRNVGAAVNPLNLDQLKAKGTDAARQALEQEAGKQAEKLKQLFK
jgi:uncharacterized protein involved in outer membrane biogenesis